jgi:hypothetical protein
MKHWISNLTRGIAYASLLKTGCETRYMTIYCREVSGILEVPR